MKLCTNTMNAGNQHSISLSPSYCLLAQSLHAIRYVMLHNAQRSFPAPRFAECCTPIGCYKTRNIIALLGGFTTLHRIMLLYCKGAYPASSINSRTVMLANAIE